MYRICCSNRLGQKVSSRRVREERFHGSAAGQPQPALATGRPPSLAPDGSSALRRWERAARRALCHPQIRHGTAQGSEGGADLGLLRPESWQRCSVFVCGVSAGIPCRRSASERGGMAQPGHDLDQLMDAMQELLFEHDDGALLGAGRGGGGRRDRQPPRVAGAGPPLPWWARSHGAPPARPVHVGRDKGGGWLYVGRAMHLGHLLPAKVAPAHSGAFVAWDGAEHSKFAYEYEVLHLVRGQAEWVEASDGAVPAHAFPVGQSARGQLAYVARVAHDGTVTPGRVMQDDDFCYISYGGEELCFRNYEVLVLR